MTTKDVAVNSNLVSIPSHRFQKAPPFKAIAMSDRSFVALDEKGRCWEYSYGRWFLLPNETTIVPARRPRKKKA